MHFVTEVMCLHTVVHKDCSSGHDQVMWKKSTSLIAQWGQSEETVEKILEGLWGLRYMEGDIVTL